MFQNSADQTFLIDCKYSTVLEKLMTLPPATIVSFIKSKESAMTKYFHVAELFDAGNTDRDGNIFKKDSRYLDF